MGFEFAACWWSGLFSLTIVPFNFLKNIAWMHQNTCKVWESIRQSAELQFSFSGICQSVSLEQDYLLVLFRSQERLTFTMSWFCVGLGLVFERVLVWPWMWSSVSVLQLLFQETNPGVRYQYTISRDMLTESSNGSVGSDFQWKRGAWTECSTTCGTGSVLNLLANRDEIWTVVPWHADDDQKPVCVVHVSKAARFLSHIAVLNVFTQALQWLVLSPNSQKVLGSLSVCPEVRWRPLRHVMFGK